MKKSKEETRTARLELRLLPVEKDLLTRAALVNDLTLSEWIRGVALAAAGKESKRRDGDERQ